ncbi:ethanolamine ammonia-lyase subunit EutC [Polaromonas sp. A23]|uniref:ethanolamine ammonia-lyase subunit EutC n=1 Tax=Polaromonas sp. A23 TaxID=1944133 RepID=UPI000984A098|nr:ethanolamine ammonia-lyase subunit EutC [Polaromonas sp. A23]OOG41193.1 ethanolamine ammonia-lyase [Polaromonas sp. A23]
MPPSKPSIVSNPWQRLRQFTAARIALGRAGVSQPTQPQLAFQLAHAQARDAVHMALDVPQLLQDLEQAGLAQADSCLVLDSAAGDRLYYLQHPDSGRRLNDASRERLKALPHPSQGRAYDLAFVVADGLSALAVARHAVPLLDAIKRQTAAENWSCAPLAVVRQARVAIGDEVGELLSAKVMVLLIGERPGLSSPDSLGIYLTWIPAPGLTDARRNCISNVRTEGLSYEEAAVKVHYLVKQMHKLQLSGVMLKDESTRDGELPKASGSNFLLGA